MTESSPSPESSPPRPASDATRDARALHLAPWAGLIVLLHVVLAAWSVNSSIAGSASAFPATRFVVSLLGPFVLALPLACVAWFIARRSSLVFNLVLSLVLVIPILGSVLTIARASPGSVRNRQILEKSRSDEAAALAELRRKHQQPSSNAPEPGASPNAPSASATRLRAAADQSTGVQAKVFRVSARMAEETAHYTDETNASMKAFKEAGGLSLSSLTQPGELDARLVLLQQAEAKCADCVESFRRLPTRIEAIGLEEGLSSAEAQEVARSLASDTRQVSLLRMMEKTSESLAGLRRTVEFLRDHAGQWQVVEGERRAQWSSDELAAEFNKLMEEQLQAATSLRALQKQVLAPPGK